MANIEPFFPIAAYSHVTDNDVLTPPLLLIFAPFFSLWIRHSEAGWALNQSWIFTMLDSFVQRCTHLLEVTKWPVSGSYMNRRLDFYFIK